MSIDTMPTDDLIIYTIPLSLASHVPPLTIPIPLGDLRQLTLRPAKFLRLIAWELLGCAGHVVSEANSCELAWEASCDDLRSGTYNFVIAPGHNPGHVMNLADVYTRAQGPYYSYSGRRHSTEPSVFDTPNSLPEVYTRGVIARRDGDRCIFSGFQDVTEAHIISQQTGMNSDYIEDLSSSRGFGFHHHRDPKNTLTLISDMWRELDEQKSFILATDPDFLHDEDIPQQLEEKDGSLSRAYRKPAANTSYIWQSLPRFHYKDGAVRRFVAHNQRALFADPSVEEHLPSAAAINYIYVGALLKRYLPESEQLRITTSERNRHIAGENPVEAVDEDKRPIDGQFCEDAALQTDMQSSNGEDRSQPCHNSPRQSVGSGLSPLELMSAIRHEVAVAEEDTVERSKQVSLDNWLGNSG